MDVDVYRRTVHIPRGDGELPLAMSVVDAGPRDALRTIVFIHGFGGRAAYWGNQLEHFSADSRVVALDLRGHGLTDAPPSRYDMAELCGDVVQALDLLKVPFRFTLVAHSFGGASGSYFIRHNPGRVERFVIIASAAKFRLRWLGRFTLSLPASLLDPVRRFVPIAQHYPPSHVVVNQNRNAMSIWDGTEYLRAIDVPTLVVLGQRDLLFEQDSYREVARLIPGAREVIVPVSAHQVMVERPDAVNRAIEHFLGPAQFTAERARRRERERELEAARPWLRFYDPRTPYQIRAAGQPVQRMMEIAARRYPRTPALEFFGRTLTYRQLDRMANRFAQALLRLGMQRGDRIGLLLPNTPQAVICYYGILKAGGVTVFLNPLFSDADLQHQIADSGARVVVALTLFRRQLATAGQAAGVQQVIFTGFDEHLGWKERLAFAAGRLWRDGHWMGRGELRRFPVKALRLGPLLRHGYSTCPEPPPAPGDLAVIQYTSGTTGSRPTGVMLSHANLAANALQMRHWLPEARPGDERVLAVLPFSHSYGLTACLNFAPLVAATLILLPNFAAETVLKTIQRHRPTVFPGVPQMYRRLSDFPGVRGYGVASIRVCVSGGAPLPAEVQEAFERLTRGRVVEGYGLTEASPVTHANPLSARRRPGSIGVPLPATEARIVDPRTGTDLPPGEVGELAVRGPQVMLGYWNAPEETALAVREGWLHTGDLARMDPDGFFTIVDRKKDLILTGSHSVYPREVEEVLYEHPAVLDAAVTAIPGEGARDAVGAFVVLREGETLSEEEALAWCRQRLTGPLVPNRVFFLPDLPRNFIGKVLRRRLIAAAGLERPA